MSFDPSLVRAQFPALSIQDDGVPRTYFDNPGGTQVAQSVIDRTVDYLTRTNANGGGAFRTSVDSDQVLDDAHEAMADLLNARSADEIVFGQNMTTLTFAMSRTLGQRFKPGDEIVVTRMDHDANISPWLLLARDLGLTVRWLPFNTRTFRYDLDALDGLLSERTVLAAVNYASNALGTVNDVASITRKVHSVGGLVYVDAVQYVPHFPTDVQALGCDFLACSAYKFFGPHQGILWGREEILGVLPAYKVRPASGKLPIRHETGTLSHEGMAGTLGAVEYLAWLGRTFGSDFAAVTGRSERSTAARRGMAAAARYERDLGARLCDGLRAIPGVTLFGIADESEFGHRVPTFIVDVANHAPRSLAERLAEHNIFVWDGDYYAQEVIDSLGVRERGGLLRIGLAHYNTGVEVDRFLSILESLV